VEPAPHAALPGHELLFALAAPFEKLAFATRAAGPDDLHERAHASSVRPRTTSSVVFARRSRRELYHRALRDQVSLNLDARYAPLGADLAVRAYPISGGLAVYFLDVTKDKLVEAHLRQAQRLEAVGRVTAGVAHDFNNLLTVIRGSASLGQAKSADPTTAAHYFDQIASAGEKATELTRQLLVFSREQELSPECLDLNQVVCEFANLLGHLLPPDIALKLELSAEPVPAFADRAQVEQILLNLVVNSRDAIGTKGVIRVTTTSVAPPRYADQVPTPSAWLEVADDGCGIPDHVLPQIFEPFFTTKPPDTGTGLGLATLYGIVSQSRGDVFVETTVDVGTSKTSPCQRDSPLMILRPWNCPLQRFYPSPEPLASFPRTGAAL
jgi:signal transduction histidine kinase